MFQGKDDVDIYMIGPMGRLSDLVIDFVQKAKKPIITSPGPQCMQTILIASTRARGLESYAYRTWKETLDFLEVLRVKKMLRETRVLCAARFGTTRSVSDMGNFVSLEHVTDVLGTQFTFVNLHELLDQTHIGKSGENYTLPGRAALNPTEDDVKEMETLADNLIGNAVECDMERKEILGSEGVFFRVKDGNDFFQKQLDVGNHVPLVYGDYFDQVCALGKHLGLNVVTA